MWDFISAIILGAVAGTIAEHFMGFKMGWVLTCILGIVGSLVGNYLFGMLGFMTGGSLIFPIIRAAIGAVIVLYGYKMFAARSS